MTEQTLHIIEQLLKQNQRLIEMLDTRYQSKGKIYRMPKEEKNSKKLEMFPHIDSKEPEFKQEQLLFVYCKKEPNAEMLNFVSQTIGNVSETIEIPTIKRNVIQITFKELRNFDKARKLLEDQTTRKKAPYFICSKFKTEQTIILPRITYYSQVTSELQRIFDRKLLGKLVDICINYYRERYNIKINLRKEEDRRLFPNYCSYIIGYDKRLTLTCNFPNYYQRKDIIETLKEKLEANNVEFINMNVKILNVQSKVNPGSTFIKLMYKTNNEIEMNKLMNNLSVFGRKLKALIPNNNT